jgi:hypothetical protein
VSLEYSIASCASEGKTPTAPCTISRVPGKAQTHFSCMVTKEAASAARIASSEQITNEITTHHYFGAGAADWPKAPIPTFACFVHSPTALRAKRLAVANCGRPIAHRSYAMLAPEFFPLGLVSLLRQVRSQRWQNACPSVVLLSFSVWNQTATCLLDVTAGKG